MKGVQKCIKTKSDTISFEGGGGTGAEGARIKVAQNGLKYILVLKFLKSNEILEITKILSVATTRQAT